MILCRVVCGLAVMIDIRSPTRAFIKVDLPALGLPIIFTNPDLCMEEKVFVAVFVNRVLVYSNFLYEVLGIGYRDFDGRKIELYHLLLFARVERYSSVRLYRKF